MPICFLFSSLTKHVCSTSASSPKRTRPRTEASKSGLDITTGKGCARPTHLLSVMVRARGEGYWEHEFPPAYKGATKCRGIDLNNNSGTNVRSVGNAFAGVYSSDLFVREAGRMIAAHPSGVPFYMYAACECVWARTNERHRLIKPHTNSGTSDATYLPFLLRFWCLTKPIPQPATQSQLPNPTNTTSSKCPRSV